MGSGLVKCFVSQQVIPEGIPVVVFPIFQSSEYRPVDLVDKKGNEIKAQTPNSSTVYSNCFYQMQGVRFTCIADDYARNIIENTLENKYSFIEMLYFLSVHSYVSKEGENKYHEQEFDIHKLLKKHNILLGEEKEDKQGNKNFEWFPPTHKPLLKSLTQNKMNDIYEELLVLGSKNRIFVNKFGREMPVVFKFAICLKKVYEHAIDFDKNFEHGAKSIVEMSLKEDLDPQSKHYHSKFLKMSLFRCFDSLKGTGASFGYNSLMHAILEEMPAQLTKEHIPHILEKMNFAIDILIFQRFLNEIEVSIQPITGYSQDYENEAGKTYKELVKIAYSEVDNFVKEKYGEE